jgi:hypothetical protein
MKALFSRPSPYVHFFLDIFCWSDFQAALSYLPNNAKYSGLFSYAVTELKKKLIFVCPLIDPTASLV